MLAPLRAHLTKAGARPVVCETGGHGWLVSSCPHPRASPSLQLQLGPLPLLPGPLLWPPFQPPYTNTPAFTHAVPHPYQTNSYSPFKTLSPQSIPQPTSKREARTSKSTKTRACRKIRPLPRPTLPSGLGRDHIYPAGECIPECLSGPAKSPRLEEGLSATPHPRPLPPAEGSLLSAPTSVHGLTCGLPGSILQMVLIKGLATDQGKPLPEGEARAGPRDPNGGGNAHRPAMVLTPLIHLIRNLAEFTQDSGIPLAPTSLRGPHHPPPTQASLSHRPSPSATPRCSPCSPSGQPEFQFPKAPSSLRGTPPSPSGF